MFVEPHHTAHGWIEVICGSMFSGKTEELIRRINRALIAKQRVGIFKPAIDVRYDHTKVVSHNQNAIRAITVNRAKDILNYAEKYEVIGIDEVQFFDHDISHVCNELANRGLRVIVSGLDMDYLGKPFGAMPDLVSIAEFVTKVHAICVCCGSIASYSYRLTAAQEQILLGEKDAYEPRCRACFVQGENVAKNWHQQTSIVFE